MTVRERFYAMIEYSGLKKSDFAKSLGITINEMAVYYGRPAISKPLRKKILDKYPEINPEWLLSGESPMLLGSAEREVDASYIISNNVEKVSMYVEGLQCNSFLKVRGFAYEPTIINGDIIGVQHQSYETLDTAKPHLIVTLDGSPMIKRIVAVDDDNLYYTTGEPNIPPFKLAKANVKGLYKVVFVCRAL